MLGAALREQLHNVGGGDDAARPQQPSPHVSLETEGARGFRVPRRPACGRALRTRAASDRLLLPRLMQELGYRGDSAELGVWIEDFSKLILKAWPSGRRHIGFDPYLAQPCVKHERDKHCITSQSDFDGIYSKTKSRLEGQFPAGRVSVLRNTSVEAAQLVRNGSLDFVYVDARHDYRSVKEDMGLWWSKVCRGGVLLGHDLIWPGVRRAVVEFVAKQKDDVHQVFITADHVSSWFFFRRPRECGAGEARAGDTVNHL